MRRWRSAWPSCCRPAAGFSGCCRPGPPASSLPPGDGIVNDPEGIGLTIGLLVKELPYLLFMILAALSQIHAERYLAAARSLGYGPMAAWFKVILPQVYPLIRLPVFAVLAYSLSVVDMALLLGPSTPPPFAVLILRWFNDPDLTMRLVAAAGGLAASGRRGGRDPACGCWANRSAAGCSAPG